MLPNNHIYLFFPLYLFCSSPSLKVIIWLLSSSHDERALAFFVCWLHLVVRAALVFLVFLLLFSSTENNVRKKRARPFSTFFFPPAQFRYNRSKKRKWFPKAANNIGRRVPGALSADVSTKVLGVFYIWHGARRGEMHKVQIVSFDIISLAVRVWSISCLIDFFFLSFADLFFWPRCTYKDSGGVGRRENGNVEWFTLPWAYTICEQGGGGQEDIYVRRDMHTRQGRDSIDVCAQAVCLLLHFFYVSERSLVLLGFSRREDGEITTTRATSALLWF